MTTTTPQHQPGCEALGGYGHGVGPCSCGATTNTPEDMAAEVKRRLDQIGAAMGKLAVAETHQAIEKSADSAHVAIEQCHAAIERMRDALEISRQSEKEAWRYKVELEGDLRAALASCAKQGEPVAYLIKSKRRPRDEGMVILAREVASYQRETLTRTPLYAAAQPADAGGPDARHVVRLPLTDVRIAELTGIKPDAPIWHAIRNTARAVERAHGITAPPSGATNGEG